ncbi:malto-oligosyltrehalose trehalohydrolase [Spirosoma terrae]|uniref:DUF3459 domain-containing protein n=1 Tax=Spirosoma terrae TaxID=1968276 RepID=A0A6L9L312_9BACT|nr:alpha-amylase family glycosyl hydrolase [Spirosoma terrae]NDU94955.1 DUF3459 domain-containing protein [Spirosoma terrae]
MMSQPDPGRRTLGVTFTAEQTAHVVVWAPLAKSIAVAVNSDPQTIPLAKDEEGYWHTNTEQIKPGDLYKFVINNEIEYADPAALMLPHGIFGSSQAFDTSSFYWEDEHWINPPVDEYIIYELDINGFTPEGTIKAIIKKLSYLKKLGVNAMLIRPVVPFPESRERSGGFLYAVQASYGTPAHLQQLVNACHFEGIAVILDLAYNGPSQRRNMVIDTGRSGRKQSAQQHRAILDQETQREADQRYLIENALMWFRDFHVDALRLEDFHAQADWEELLQSIRSHTNALTNQTGRHYYLLIEHETPGKIVSGCDDSERSVSVKSIDESNTLGYYDDCKNARHQSRAFQENYIYDQQFSSVLKSFFDREDDMSQGEPMISISQNCNRSNNYLFQTYSDEYIDRESLKLMAGYIMVSPCIPTVFMGEEWGMANPFREVMESALVGSGCSESTVAQVEKTAAVAALPWENLSQCADKTLFSYYQALTRLRRQQPALYHLNRRQTETIHDEEQQTMILHRWYKNNHVLCLMNFSPEKQTMKVPDLSKEWQKLLDSGDPVWQGLQASPDRLADADTITLQPESIVIYKAV